jgi:hypothetical protein
VREVDVAAVLGIYGVPHREWEPLLRLARPQLDPVMVSVMGPARFAVYGEWVSGADRVVEFGATELPWAVCTPEYAKALLAPAEVPVAALASLGAGTFSGRPVLVPRPRGVTLLVHEWALRTPVGGPVVMAGQLEYLEWLSRSAGYLVRVVPVEAGAVGAHGSFGLVGWHEDRLRPVVLRFERPALVGCDDPDMVAGYQARVEELLRVAWDGVASRDFLRHLGIKMRSAVGVDVVVGAGGGA